ncbi:hypothetical protein [Streptomyces sp. LaPpAH-108]|uniref:hypothetical protein n=1 Tax=Streptomyces sp. LaPpAH-108 TaxID=1155714 RepID=UPI0003723AD9|nr:hypothetical protein [Streptomyces sp. LaPpAH-108]
MGGDAIRRLTAVGAAVLTVLGVLVLAAPGAGAAPRQDCPGRQVRALPFRTGVVRLYKREGYVCALTLAKVPGTPRVMSVSVQARGNRPVTDQGRYRHHAGPVTVHAGHRCVRVRGAVGRGSVSSGWILC